MKKYILFSVIVFLFNAFGAMAFVERQYTRGSDGWKAAMGKLRVGNISCSAAAITQKHILTAAHCVSPNRRRSDLIQFYPYVESFDSDSTGYAAIRGAIGPEAWVGFPGDWAILELEDELPAAVTPIGLAVSVNQASRTLLDRHATVAGYPSDLSQGEYLVHDDQCTMGESKEGRMIVTLCKVVPGNSGGVALDTKPSQNEYAFGLRTPAYAYGVVVGLVKFRNPSIGAIEDESGLITPSENFYKQAQEFVGENGYSIDIRYVGANKPKSTPRPANTKRDDSDFYSRPLKMN